MSNINLFKNPDFYGTVFVNGRYLVVKVLAKYFLKSTWIKYKM